MRCAVNNCGNNNRKGNRNKWRYFHFPKDKQQLQKWIEFCERDITNTATACICNEHFTPADFERNMQYELGFTRKNPTKLKPGSNPSIHGAQQKATARGKGIEKTTAVLEQDYNAVSFPRNKVNVETTDDCMESVYLESDEDGDDDDVVDHLEHIAELSDNSDETIEYSISHMEDYNATDMREIELEIIDPLNPQTNAEEHLEIIDAGSDSYVKHLEIEVSTLKREVFFLKDERKKLMNEIQNLRNTIRNSHELEAERT